MNVGAIDLNTTHAASVQKGARAGQAEPAKTTGDDFSSLIGEAIAGVAGQLRQAEAMSVKGIKGVASTQDVVEQVLAAEQALQASIAIRDKVVAAYLEISRMSI